MSNKQLPAEIQERIKADAEKLSGYNENRGDGGLVNKGRYYGYIAGATAERERAQVLVDALVEIERRIKLGKAGASYQIEMIRPVVIKALERWKGKEVEL